MKEVIDFNQEAKKQEAKKQEAKKQEAKRKFNKKKIAILISIIILICLILTCSIIYNNNKSFRDFMDKYIFQKNITNENVVSIEFDSESNTSIIPNGKYICILSENTLAQYNILGKKELEVKIEINNPIYETSGRYLVIGEKDSQKLYLISGNTIIWEKQIDGNISNVNVNKNGYVSCIITGTTYKSVIVAYDEKGNELFKTYLSSTIAIDSSISNDNEYLSFAEINTSGTTIQSNIKTISIKNAVENKEEPIIYTYTASQNSMVLDIEYQDKNRLVCLYDDSIHMIESEVDMVLLQLNEADKKITFADIGLNNYAFRSVEISTGLFNANTDIQMINISNQKEHNYTVEGVAKDIICYNNVVAVNLGSEINFIDTSGWLMKRYISSQEVRDIVICDDMAGIVYRDKIEIVNL